MAIILTGITGTRYEYHLASVNGHWNDVPGNYAFIGASGRVLYVGQTGSFAQRRPGPGHEKWVLACNFEPASIFAHVTGGGEVVRLAEELDLIRAYNPPCNVQNNPHAPIHRQEGALSGLAPPTPRKTLLGGL